MKHGDFTNLAKFYGNRTGYSINLLECLKAFIESKQGNNIQLADVGAGTGKLTENLQTLGLTGFAVEPNDAMREEGIKVFKNSKNFLWSKGSAENTGLSDSCVDWVLMGSSFHWTDSALAMEEFHRILRPGGFFTAIWNPRDIASSELHQQIEKVVYKNVPNMKRVSSGSIMTTEDMKVKLLGSSLFEELMFIEAPHYELMSKERYMNAWRSVNDIQVQAEETGFNKILDEIEELIGDMEKIEVPYRSRSWTVRSTKG